MRRLGYAMRPGLLLVLLRHTTIPSPAGGWPPHHHRRPATRRYRDGPGPHARPRRLLVLLVLAGLWHGHTTSPHLRLLRGVAAARVVAPCGARLRRLRARRALWVGVRHGDGDCCCCRLERHSTPPLTPPSV